MSSKLEKKLEQKVMNHVKKKVLRKKIRQRIAKGQILPVPALASAGVMIAAGFTVVPITTAVVGWQVHKFIKKRKSAAAQTAAEANTALPVQAAEPAPHSEEEQPSSPDKA